MSSETNDSVPASARVRVKRIPDRGAYDLATVFSILDDTFICHVGFTVDGQPYVIPTGFARVEDHLYLHGSSASRMLRELSKGIDVCVTVTILDGLVLARSVFNHSMNYRSAMLLGKAELVTDEQEKLDALRALTEHFIPGRWNEARLPTLLELKATSVLKLKISEASAKLRSGPPSDDDEDHALDVWAGVIPLSTIRGNPIPDPALRPDIEIPDSVRSQS